MWKYQRSGAECACAALDPTRSIRVGHIGTPCRINTGEKGHRTARRCAVQRRTKRRCRRLLLACPQLIQARQDCADCTGKNPAHGAIQVPALELKLDFVRALTASIPDRCSCARWRRRECAGRDGDRGDGDTPEYLGDAQERGRRVDRHK